MTNEPRGYSAKAKVRKALERQAAKLPESIEVLSVKYEKGDDGKWYGFLDVEMANLSDTIQLAVLETMAEFHVSLKLSDPPAAAATPDSPAPATKPRGPRGHSTIHGPCFTVWSVADEMTDAKRGEVIKACQDLGVAFYTARTQYQKWSKARKTGSKSMPAKKEQPSAE